MGLVVDHDLPSGYPGPMERVGVRELRQNPNKVLSEVEHGGEVVVTVQGRPVARMVPLSPERWIPGEQAMSVFDAPVDENWAADLDELRADFTMDDPWAGAG